MSTSNWAFAFYDEQFQLIRIELRVPEYGWTTQKVFHLMNFIVNGGEILGALMPFGLSESLNTFSPFFLTVIMLSSVWFLLLQCAQLSLDFTSKSFFCTQGLVFCSSISPNLKPIRVILLGACINFLRLNKLYWLFVHTFVGYKSATADSAWFIEMEHKMQAMNAKLGQLYVGPGIDIGLIGSSWTAILLYVHTSCPLLGRDISPGKCSFSLILSIVSAIRYWFCVIWTRYISSTNLLR